MYNLKDYYKPIIIEWDDIEVKEVEYCDNCLSLEAKNGNIAIFCDLCQAVYI